MPFEEEELKEYPRASDVIVPEVIPPKYPGFSEFTQKKKVDILSTEIAFKDCSLETILIRLGITYDEYKQLCVETDILDLVVKKSRARVMPYIPEAYEALGRDAADGDPVKLKLLLQATKELDVEGTIQNQNLMHMDNAQLLKELKQLQIEAAELIDEEDESTE